MTARYSTRRFLVTFFLIAVILGLIGHRPLWGQDAIADFDGAVRAAIESVSPSVVRIETVGGSERVGDFAVGTAATTGLVVSDDGLVLTSAFGFVQEPSSIIVRLDGQPNGAKVVARDHARKLVLLKIERETAGRVPDVVPRSDLRVGQTAIALGKTYSSDTPSVSIGIMSALNRIWGRAVQTDCKVSPANYGGPLIDLHGRVIGLLVPMSPQQQTDLAGLEWYDSGIGFAVPLSEVITVIDRLKAGEDLHPGLLGITLKGRNIYADEAIIATTAPNSPAEKAGLQVGDNIIEVAGQAIARQAELKHVLGTLYAGQSVALTVQRDGQSVAIEVELVQTIEPYEHAFLGVLPLRVEGDAVGVPVRYVYPGSPAEKLGLVRGDRLTHLNGEEVKDSLAWLERLAQHVPGDEVEIKYVRGDQEHVGRVALASLPAETPAESLPPAIDEGEP
ncbi:MAG: PDZ domain-containing protein, partial [Planctomycetales bacterium]|nr:PDZ domain-containing protein [Planctomycetales bacterium]